MERKSCPYLGLQDDPNTALDFPSVGNACHRANPVAPVEISHQEKYCLGPGFKACPIYMIAETQNAPAMFAAPSFIKDQRKRRIAILAIPFIAAGVLGLGFLLNGFVAKYALLGANRIPQTGANQASSLGMFAPQSTPLPLSLPAFKATLTPEATPTSCQHPQGWNPYTVAPTDSLFRLSAVYNVSVEDLQKGNCMGNQTVILPGNVIYVPLLPSPTPTLTPTATFTASPTNTATRPMVVPTSGDSRQQDNNPAPAQQPVPPSPVPPTQAPQVAPTSAPPANPPEQPAPKPPENKPPEVKPPENKQPDNPKPPKTDKPPKNDGGHKGDKGKGGKGKGG